MSLADIRARNEALRAAGKLPGAIGTNSAPVRISAPPRHALFVLAPCAHGGTDADIVERCPSCGSSGAKHVRECEIHSRATWEPVNPDVMDCGRCRREGLGYAPVRDSA